MYAFRKPEDRRCEPRRSEDVGRAEPLWLICRGGATGGQATLRDISTHGIGAVVDRRAWRLVAALRDAEDTQTPVIVSRIPGERQREASVRWHAADELGGIRFGLQLTEPLEGQRGFRTMGKTGGEPPT